MLFSRWHGWGIILAREVVKHHYAEHFEYHVKHLGRYYPAGPTYCLPVAERTTEWVFWMYMALFNILFLYFIEDKWQGTAIKYFFFLNYIFLVFIQVISFFNIVCKNCPNDLCTFTDLLAIVVFLMKTNSWLIITKIKQTVTNSEPYIQIITNSLSQQSVFFLLFTVTDFMCSKISTLICRQHIQAIIFMTAEPALIIDH